MAEKKKRSGTGRKKSVRTAPQGRVRRKETEAADEAKIEQFRAESGVILLFAFSVLLFLSNFGLCGAAGRFFRKIDLGLFGAVGYLFPILLFLCFVYGVANQGNRAALMKIPAGVLATVAVAGIIHLFFGPSLKEAGSAGAFFTGGKAGGLIGGLFASACTAALGKTGAFIIMAVTFIISMVCITEKSFVNAVKDESGRAYRHAREDLDRRRAQHQELRKQRSEREVSGVDFDATDLSLSAAAAAEPAAKPAAEPSAEPESGTPFDTDRTPVFPAGTDAGLPGGDVMPAAAVPVTGNYDYDTDEVPFEADDALAASSAFSRADAILQNKQKYAAPYEAESSEAAEAEEEEPDEAAAEMPYAPAGPSEPEEPPFAEDSASSAGYQDPETDQLYRQTLDRKGGERTVVTANGKVIESMTDAVHRKMTEARKNTEAGEVAETVKKKAAAVKPYVFPPFSLLERPKKTDHPVSDREYRETAAKLQQTLGNFGVKVTVTNISCGPVVTRYELHPEQGVKVSRIVALADDIKLSLAASDIRIEAPIPGKSAVGIEVPNRENNTVYLRELLESENFLNNKYKLAFALGKDIGGQIVVTDISKMPHLLIAGATGSGKSVCINTLIMSILFKYKPEDVKLMMIDPKVVELSVYNGIPHLLIPVVTDPKKAAGALNWAVAEMTERYKKFAAAGVRDLRGYNERIGEAKKSGTVNEEELPVKMPQIVIIIDELADLMMVAQNEVEDAICRLAQLARAAGLHLVIATQRPSVNVITGLIKANIPSRIAFAVASGVDSRTILDGVGAEKLLGKGDMLFSPQGAPKPMRIQGAFVSDQEVQKVVDYIGKQGCAAVYDPETEERIAVSMTESTGPDGSDSGSRDELFAQAGRFIIEKDKASIGNLQRMFKIGFNRAARIMDQLCEAGVVGEEQGTKPREILLNAEQFEELVRKS